MDVKVFFCEPTDRQRQWLRRYSQSDKRVCSATGHFCNAQYDLGEGDVTYTKDGYIACDDSSKPPNDDPRWPTKCEACGVPFAAEDAYQLFSRQLYVRLDTGDTFTLEAAPPGACWDAWWISDRRKNSPTGCGYDIGDDHRSLVVKLPDGSDWHVDHRASNCTLPNDMSHHCWVRHGKPEDGTLHVDKNGHTCAAGAGSIQTKKWHGFLHNGYLRG